MRKQQQHKSIDRDWFFAKKLKIWILNSILIYQMQHTLIFITKQIDWFFPKESFKKIHSNFDLVSTTTNKFERFGNPLFQRNYSNPPSHAHSMYGVIISGFCLFVGTTSIWFCFLLLLQIPRVKTENENSQSNDDDIWIWNYSVQVISIYTR